jgi:hypothetical protein
MPGPPPKPGSQRRPRNKTQPSTRVAVHDAVRGPELTGEHSEVAVRFWQSLRTSGQAEIYQPSDWSAAELVVVAIDAFTLKPQASMLASIRAGMAALLVSEADRRRVREELERAPAEREDGSGVARREDMRRRLYERLS